MASKIISSRSPGGRLLTIEWVDPLPSPTAYLEEIARHDGHDGYVVVAEEITGYDPLPQKKEGEGSLHVSILLRPAMPASRSMMLTAIGALALVHTARRHSSLDVGIRWVGDVYAGKQRIANATTKGSLRSDGHSFRYVLVNLSLRTTDAFAGSLSEVVKSVFSPYRETKAERIADTLINEFFTLYESFATSESNAFLDEYRERSLLRGKRIRFLKNGKRVRATVIGIDDSTRLVVTPRRGESVVLHSASELYDPSRPRKKSEG